MALSTSNQRLWLRYAITQMAFDFHQNVLEIRTAYYAITLFSVKVISEVGIW